MHTVFTLTIAAALAAGAALAQEINFERLDRDGDGYVNEREWSAFYDIAYFDTVDENGDGRIDLVEARTAAREENGVQAQRDTDAAIGAGAQQAETGLSRTGLRQHDRNGDGKISPEEAESADLEAVAEQFDSWDANADGFLDAREYDRAVADFGRYDVDEDEDEDGQVN